MDSNLFSTSNLINEMGVLYELSLAIGRSTDLQENCSSFLSVLSTRKSLEFSAVWVYQQYLSVNESPDPNGAQLIHATPLSAIQDTSIPSTHQFLKQIESQSMLTFKRDNQDGYIDSTSGSEQASHFITLFKLGKIGILELHHKNEQAFAARVKNQFRPLLDKFSISLMGNLYSQQSQREIEARRQVQIRRDAILNAALDAIITIESTGELIEFNPAAERIFGYQAVDILGKRMSDLLVPPEYREGHQNGVAKYLKTGEGPILGQRIEITGMRANGEIFPIELTVVPVQLKDKTIFTAYLRDITQRVQQQKALHEYANELERSNKELQDFAYIASHDLQEPLRKIQAFGDRLIKRSRNDLDERSQDYVDRMLSAAGRMQNLINSLLQLSRVTTSGQPYEQTDLNKVISQVKVDLEVTISDNEATVTVDELPIIDADPVQIGQLFQNLISNSLKFKQADQETIINISAHAVPDQPGLTELRFKDNGIGFKPEYSERIFGVFQRLHGRQKFAGTGIGLAICRKIIERHNGEIWAESEGEGQGASFVVHLPLKQLI